VSPNNDGVRDKSSMREVVEVLSPAAEGSRILEGRGGRAGGRELPHFESRLIHSLCMPREHRSQRYPYKINFIIFFLRLG